ncbi:hypothetical protein DCS_02692 [Drechmeria coniospora]|uniref:Fe2OG dioxygenase domain-containing protein n=1 Tax=Drechmeria coniospora TaxID=98403 RepID=A0A151GWU8_DRECN|nr:hypothetical protein DCS_02692 [Drechmeria coniospora]KYK61550.1 hypothetical protein DCS_02692 [Drechmeria coniospora]ODA79809.1 hypothetical protein RJ55_05405 [Drechmeria coniospora]
MAAQLDDGLPIPIIDFAPLLSDDCRQRLYTDAAKELYLAFKNIGFAYIKNYGTPPEVVDEAFAWSHRFFALPQEEKDKVPHPPEGWNHRGYSTVGREKVSQMVFDKAGIAKQRRVPDMKESFEMGNEKAARARNIWPAEEVLPGFRRFFTDFFEACYQLEVKLLRAIAVGMGLDDGFFVDYHRNKDNQVRLLRYPPVEEALLAAGKVDCIGAHTDFATLTMLFQDAAGGLEVERKSQKGRFDKAPYVPGTIVVNIGDFLMRWSNDELTSTMHRVRTSAPADSGEAAESGDGSGPRRMTRERFSIPYFVAADRERIIDCVPGCWGPDRPKKYEPISAGEYADMRLNATY